MNRDAERRAWLLDKYRRIAELVMQTAVDVTRSVARGDHPQTTLAIAEGAVVRESCIRAEPPPWIRRRENLLNPESP